MSGRTALFVPCYVDQLYPRAALATLALLEQYGVAPDFPRDQTCCGQPMVNAGCVEEARGMAERFVRLFDGYDQIVCPSASCVAMVRRYEEFFGPAAGAVASRTHEICQFVTDVLGVSTVDRAFSHRVGLHQSCHGLRELGQGTPSECVGPRSDSPAQRLLSSLRGIELVELARPDECCGFGGLFSVEEPAVSCAMGRGRIADHASGGVEVMTSIDMSCLAHLQGLMRRDGSPMRVAHVAEILAGFEVSV